MIDSHSRVGKGWTVNVHAIFNNNQFFCRRTCIVTFPKQYGGIQLLHIEQYSYTGIQEITTGKRSIYIYEVERRKRWTLWIHFVFRLSLDSCSQPCAGHYYVNNFTCKIVKLNVSTKLYYYLYFFMMLELIIQIKNELIFFS